MKTDMQKAKLKEAHNQPAAVAKAIEMNDATAMRRRGRMMLPAPQVQHLAPFCTRSECRSCCWSCRQFGIV